MTAVWVAIAVATAGCFTAKYLGHVVSGAVLQRDDVARVVLMAPVALLCALAAVQTVVSGSALVVDARLPAVAVAVVALLLRAPFVVVVLLAAATAAALRALGWAA